MFRGCITDNLERSRNPTQHSCLQVVVARITSSRCLGYCIENSITACTFLGEIHSHLVLWVAVDVIERSYRVLDLVCLIRLLLAPILFL